MTAVNQIVNVQMLVQGTAVTQANFNTPLVVGPNATSTLAYYSSAAAMLTAGFTTSNPEYVYVNEVFSQQLSPPLCGVGKRTTAVAQVDTVVVATLGSTGTIYSFTLNGTLITYTQLVSDTQASILTGLNTAIGVAFATRPATGAVSGSGSGATLTLTSAVAGAGVSYSGFTTNLTHANTTPNNGIANDLALIQNATGGNNWYGLALCSNVDADILQAASYIEATGNKIFIAATNDSAVATAVTTDIASQMMALGYKRTALIYSPNNYNIGIDAGWLGGQLPQQPGSSTWKFKPVTGASPDSFTSAVRTILIGTQGVPGKNVNIYENIGGANIMEEGWMVGGQFIDVTIFLDWLTAQIQTNIYTALVTLPKIPFTDKGIALIVNQIFAALKAGSDEGGSGGLQASTIQITAAKASTISQANQIARILPAGAVTWTFTLTGAFHFINVSGTVVL